MDIQLIKISEEDRTLLSGFIGEDVGNEIDFNRLMPVVEKIETGLKWRYAVETEISLYTDEPEYKTIIHDEGNATYMDMPREKERLLSVYKAVVEFIKWYGNEESNR